MHKDAVVSWGARAVRGMAIGVLLGAASPALGQELIGELQAEVVNFEWTMQAIANDAELCDGLVSELLEKIDRSASVGERKLYKDYLKTARRCAATTNQVIRDGVALNRRCSSVLNDLRDVNDAPAGSNAARRRGAVRKAASGCVTGFGKWKAQVEDLKEVLNVAMDIMRST
ncbi:hypothetical protein QEG98_23730 [Myxococcus sp. MxC21-1]|uniref:hypothetical protein n=1 Tax=Myxococcus sp. MxC21-1 TaxID=3041439 RepID=UPI00292DC363|nr:hypothetical protein [Myxococcus sp. MxC21-1]WNZ59111.1 hypothetical protein QEG98_23730 [Myxococcus sp. MxC21-1]